MLIDKLVAAAAISERSEGLTSFVANAYVSSPIFVSYHIPDISFSCILAPDLFIIFSSDDRTNECVLILPQGGAVGNSRLDRCHHLVDAWLLSHTGAKR